MHTLVWFLGTLLAGWLQMHICDQHCVRARTYEGRGEYSRVRCATDVPGGLAHGSAHL